MTKRDQGYQPSASNGNGAPPGADDGFDIGGEDPGIEAFLSERDRVQAFRLYAAAALQGMMYAQGYPACMSNQPRLARQACEQAKLMLKAESVALTGKGWYPL